MFEVNRSEILRLVMNQNSTLVEFSRRSGITLPTLRKIFRGNVKSFSLQTISKLANALGVVPESLLKGD